MFAEIAEKQIDDGVSFCPECGAKVGAPTEQPKKRYAPASIVKTAGGRSAPTRRSAPTAAPGSSRRNKKPVNALGIAGFVLSIISLWGGSVFVVPIVGLILSAIGVAQREKYSSSGFATAGLVISIVTLVFWALMVALIVTGVVTGFFDAFFRAVYPSETARLLTKQENGTVRVRFFSAPFLQAGR